MARLSTSSAKNAGPRPMQSGPLWAPLDPTLDRNFWGMTVKPGKSIKVKFSGDRLCVTQATLGRRSKNVPKGNGRSCLYVKKGRKRPLCVCSLRRRTLEMWMLDLMYKSPCNIRFINHGYHSIHLIGYSYFLPSTQPSPPIDTTYAVEEETLQEPVVENGGNGHQNILQNECGTLKDDEENRVGETASIFPDNDHENITTTILDAEECANKDGPDKNVNERLVIALEIPTNMKKRKMKKVDAQSVSDTTTVLDRLSKEPIAENGGHAYQSISISESKTLGGEKNRVEVIVEVLPENDMLNISPNIPVVDECATKNGGDEEHSHVHLEFGKNVHESPMEIPKKSKKKFVDESDRLLEAEQIVQPPKKKSKDKDISGNDSEKFSNTTTNAVEELLKEPIAENVDNSHQNTSVNECETLRVEEHRVGEAVLENMNMNDLTIVRKIYESAAKDLPDKEHHITSESEENAHQSDTTMNAVEELLKEPIAENVDNSQQNTSVNESETFIGEEHRVGKAVSEDINVNIFTMVRDIQESSVKDLPDEEHCHITSVSQENAHQSSEISKKERKKSKKIERESASLPKVEDIVQSPKTRRQVKAVAENEAKKSRSVGGKNPTSLNSRQDDTEEILQPTPLSILVPTPKGMKEKPTKRLITNDEHQVIFSGTHGAASLSREFVLALSAHGKKNHAATKNREDPNPNIIDEHDVRFEMFHH